YRGPTTPLAAERARQARIAIVGPVTERWAPEQAGPVHENWQLAPPIGPSTDLWALGALLYRAVQGHAPYPEENAAELVQLVCAEPPAFAEECGALRPVVESLLRQDPTERPDFEELRGWLRSLVRSAPEPEAGADIVALPSIDGRLPIVRRKGELVRRRRRGEMGRHRHKNKNKKKKEIKESRARRDTDVRESQRAVSPEGRYVGPGAAEFREEPARQEEYDRTEQFERYEEPGRPEPARARGSRHLGRTLLILVLLLLVAGVVYAVMFLPKSGEEQGASTGDTGSGASAAPVTPGASNGAPAPAASSKDGSTAPGSAGSATPQETVPASNLPAGYVLRKDSEGFQVAVPKDWQRRPINDSQQIRYVNGAFQLIVVPGRDSAADMGNDPMKYQLDKEPELAPYRSSSWATSGNLLRIDVGQMATAEGLFTWQDSNGGEIAVRNVAMIINGRYHILQVMGPKGEGDKVKEIFELAKPSYKVTR
ncbi:serine/threonine protein kinase, partial [Streptomyces sp. 150FB]